MIAYCHLKHRRTSREGVVVFGTSTGESGLQTSQAGSWRASSSLGARQSCIVVYWDLGRAPTVAKTVTSRQG